MKTLLARSSTAVLVAAAALSAACSNDPLAPKAPSATRTPTASAPSHSIGAVQASSPMSKAGAVIGGPADGASTNSGYIISWAREGQTTPNAASGVRAPSGQ